MTYEDLARSLLQQGEGFLRSLFPNGRVSGNTFLIGDVDGNSGDSLNVDMLTGKWYDFADNEQRGLDYLSLYAAAKHIKNSEAFKLLTGEEPVKPNGTTPPKPAPPPKPKYKAIPVPDSEATWFPGTFRKFKCATWWRYRDTEGRIRGYTARYDTPEGKIFTTWQYTEEGWKPFGFAQPLPLYGEELLAQYPTMPILIVEGEKACEAARDLCGKFYLAITWPQGKDSILKANWSLLAGRSVLLWPDNDADSGGQMAMLELAQQLKLTCPTVKFIDPKDKPPKWDAADAVAEGMNLESWVQWAKPLARVLQEPPRDASKPDAGGLYNLWVSLGLELRGRPAVPLCTLNNVVAVLEGVEALKNHIWWDSFRRRPYTDWTGKLEEWGGHKTIELQLFMQRNMGMDKMNKEPVRDAAVAVAHRNVRNPIQEFIDALPPWDGTKRIDHFLINCYGAEKSDYSRAASRNFWLSLAARAMRPGCKVDNVLILEGEQGIKKSSSLEVIVGKEWCSTVQHDVGTKDFLGSIQGKLINEIAEMAAFSKAETEKVKNVISIPSDRFRVPYAETEQDYPRQGIFVVTCNPGGGQYFKDETGNRRYWPVKVVKADLELIAAMRFQLWAEAVQNIRTGSTWWDMPVEATLAEQNSRLQEDVWMQTISEYLTGKEYVGIRDIATGPLQIAIGKVSTQDTQRISRCLVMLGWENKGQKRFGPNVLRVWGPKEVQTKESPAAGLEQDGA